MVKIRGIVLNCPRFLEASNGKAYFSLLWLPSRFGAIFNYLYFMVAVTLFLAVRVLFKKFFVRFYRNFYRVMYKY